jgi:hypothetical protein
MIRNPFITSGYVSADYFCDRRFESEQLVREVMNGNNLALVSTRRMGKTGLIRHCFQFPEIKQGYYTFFIDIYDSRSLRDLVFALSKEILEVLKPMGKKALHGFWECVKSLQASISFDELLPASRVYGNAHTTIVGISLGMFVMAISLVLFKLI